MIIARPHSILHRIFFECMESEGGEQAGTPTGAARSHPSSAARSPVERYPWSERSFCAACFCRRAKTDLHRCGGCYAKRALRTTEHAELCLVTAYYCKESGHSKVGCRAQHWPQHKSVCPRRDKTEVGAEPEPSHANGAE